MLVWQPFLYNDFNLKTDLYRITGAKIQILRMYLHSSQLYFLL